MPMLKKRTKKMRVRYQSKWCVVTFRGSVFGPFQTHKDAVECRERIIELFSDNPKRPVKPRIEYPLTIY